MKKDKSPLLSVVIPVFNELKRIHKLEEIVKYLKKQKFSNELIVVNDGSLDDTLEKLKKLQKKYSFKVVSYSQNQGKGYAIKQGMKQARGDYHLFADVDLSTPIEEIKKFLPQLKKYDVVIGTRKTKGSKLLVRQARLREFLGKGFTFLSQNILGVNVSDFTCGFKAFKKDSSEKIFSNLSINRWGFDSEILFLASKYGFDIKEVPIEWRNDAESKVKFPEDIIRSLNDLITIRINNFKGKYHG